MASLVSRSGWFGLKSDIGRLEILCDEHSRCNLGSETPASKYQDTNLTPELMFKNNHNKNNWYGGLHF